MRSFHSSKKKNTLHQVLTPVFTWYIWRTARGYLSYMLCACWRCQRELWAVRRGNVSDWNWKQTGLKKVCRLCVIREVKWWRQRFERAPLSPILAQLHKWCNYCIFLTKFSCLASILIVFSVLTLWFPLYMHHLLFIYCTIIADI